MVFGLFSKDRALQRTIEKATNKLAQQPDRWGALERLRDDGTDEALYGLCKRFGITSMKGVEDEQEKNWVVDVLVEHGKAALAPLVRYMKSADQLAFPLRVLERIADKNQQLEVVDVLVEHGPATLIPLTRYMKTAEQLAFPLKVLERIAGHDQQLAIVDELFKTEPPGYVRMPERRIDLIKWFCEHKAMTDAEVVSRITPYLVDFDENSRFSAIEGLATKDKTLIAEPLVDALLRPEEESGRIRRTIVEVLEKTKAPLGDRASRVAGMLSGQLADDFKVDGAIVKKK